MAGDVGGVDPSNGGMLAAAAGIIGGAIGAFGLWLANRMLGKAAFQTAINAGFKELTDQLQEERREAQSRWDAERKAWAAERLAWAGERAQLRGEIINLTQAVESLKAFLRRNGLPIPDVHSPAVEYIVIEATDEDGA